jgi:signal transduction histidine kinase
MHTLRVAAYGLMALALAAGWAFLYWQSSALDLGAIEQARGALAGLRAIDARWADRLAPGRVPAAPSPAGAAPLAYRSAYGALEVRALRLGNAEVARALAGLKAALDDKAALLERLAAARSALAEAERAAPPDEAKVSESRALAGALFEQAWLVSTGPRLELVARAIDRAFDEALAQAELYRAWLLYYSGFLLVVLAYALWRLYEGARALDRANAGLRDANETLELRVRERTRELSQALARLKESEAMLVQSEKMASLGQMVAGLVHEVNTPLAYVKSSMEGLAKRVPELARLVAEVEALLALLAAEGADEAALAARFAAVRASLEQLRARSTIEEIGRQAEDGMFGIGRIGELVASLKNFSRLDRSHVAQVNLHEGLESAIRIARHTLGQRELVKEFGAIAKITCSPSQVNQVFLNLLTNAAQATPEAGGRITVRTFMPDARHVAVEVADNGHGIAPEALPRIFDPFFTTKAVGQGTGLGLAISYRIVQSHGGRLEVASAPGRGARFTVVLPLEPAAAAAAA